MLSILALSVSLALAATSASAAPTTTPHGISVSQSDVDGRSFDYIIIGGGLAGLTVASRLSENSSISVLVIEAGADDRTNPWVYDLHQYFAFSGSSLDWAWKTEGGKEIKGGKTLGGSSSINGGHYTRGDAVQYDAWNKLISSSTWGWDKMFSYMKKSEGFNTPTAAQTAAGASYNLDYHGVDGPLQVSFPGGMYTGPGQSSFNKTISSSAFGVPFSEDANGGEAARVAFTLSMMNPSSNYDRSSSASAYFSPVESTRTNWLILTEHQATQIGFEDSPAGQIARSVFLSPGAGQQKALVWANKEVIVSAGAIQSPALLQMSGIGPDSLLKSVGVDTVVDLPGVGKNLNEQTSNVIGYTPISGVGFDGTGPSDTIAFPSFNQLFGSDADSAASKLRAALPAYASGANGFVSEEAATKILDLQLGLVLDDQVGMAELFFDSGYPNGGFGFDIWNLLPFSRGSVEITTIDPFTPPKIDPKYFDFDFDLDVQAAAMRMGRRVFKTAPLSDIVSGENSPGTGTVADDSTGGSLDDWKTYVKGSYGSVSHPISTCAMMDRELGGVVDEHLKVYGTTNLRVVDASVLPMQVSAHLSASIYGVAEYAADLIKADSSSSSSSSSTGASSVSSSPSSVGSSPSSVASNSASAASASGAVPNTATVSGSVAAAQASDLVAASSGGSPSPSATPGSSNAGTTTSSAISTISLRGSSLAVGMLSLLLLLSQ